MSSAVEQRSEISPSAGQPAPTESLIDPSKLEYYAGWSDLDDELVSVGTNTVNHALGS